MCERWREGRGESCRWRRAKQAISWGSCWILVVAVARGDQELRSRVEGGPSRPARDNKNAVLSSHVYDDSRRTNEDSELIDSASECPCTYRYEL